MSVGDEIGYLEVEVHRLKNLVTELEDELEDSVTAYQHERVLDERDSLQDEVNDLRSELYYYQNSNPVLDLLANLGFNKVEVQLALQHADKLNKINDLLRKHYEAR